jgi:hypothetical protein
MMNQPVAAQFNAFHSKFLCHCVQMLPHTAPAPSNHLLHILKKHTVTLRQKLGDRKPGDQKNPLSSKVMSALPRPPPQHRKLQLLLAPPPPFPGHVRCLLHGSSDCGKPTTDLLYKVCWLS